MELDRPHRRPPSTTSDLFICFSSRLSKSSAMRLSSKSMVSPGRTDKPSLSASLSRRLSRKNGSFRGVQSPMFPPGLGMGKKRGSSIDNPEPSSPKVTCIGQVRVKTKKHGKKMKMNMKKAYRARRSGSNGSKDMSFRRNEGEGCLQHRNQRWVHLPVTICDAVRAFGSELNCFSSCCFPRSEKRRKEGCRRSRSCSCGGSMCSWFVSLHEGEEVKKRRDIELVVGEEKEVREERGRRAVMERNCSRRRPVFDDLDFSVGEIFPEKKKEEIEEEEEEEEEEEKAARVSISVPPKNALILMRCRSDPVKMSALANRFWESPPKEGQEQEEESGRRRSSSFNETEKVSRFLKGGEEKQLRLSMEKKEEKRQSTEKVVEEVSEASQESAETGLQTRVSIDCREHLWIYGEDEEQNLGIVENPEANEAVTSIGQCVDPVESAPPIQDQLEEEKEDQIDIEQTSVGKESIFEQLEEVKTQNKSVEEEEDDEELESGEVVMEEEEEAETSALPDCLLLMMCEPKLSMEVSKETWVCSTDFIRRLPERHRQHHLKKINPSTADDEAVKNSKKKNRAEPNPAPPPPAKPPVAARKPPPAPQQGVQPPRSSCSFPIGGKVAGAKDKKQGNAEPLVLTRCKSAPMRSATAKLAAAAPELVCSWKNRKIEPHRAATCGVGARAGAGC